MKTTFIDQCISDTLTGIRDGLSLFSGTIRVALIYAIDRNDPLTIFDPQNLLYGHQPKLATIYQNDSWCRPADPNEQYHHIIPQHDPQLDGVICEGGSSPTIHYQMWFADQHPNLCSTQPTRHWLRHAVLRLSHDIANSSLYTGISGKFLREYTIHAINDCLNDKTIQKTLHLDRKEISHILDTVLAISKTNEEGQRPFGKLCFVSHENCIKSSFISRFSGKQLPLLAHAKHVRKLLQTVEHSDNNILISDGKHILGIAKLSAYQGVEGTLIADFQGRKGFLSANAEAICSFYDGNYSSNTFSAKLVEVEEALLDFNLTPEIRSELFQATASLVHCAEKRGYGCGIVIDLSPESMELAGQPIEPPLDLRNQDNYQLAAAFMHVDGAIHIRSDLKLHRFACLLDGFRIKGEDRSRGARYNSALRFTAQHPETILIVVSSDNAVSVFQKGKVLHPEYPSYGEDSAIQCQITALPLARWLNEFER